MHILLSQTGSYRDVVDHLRLRGAQVISVGPANAAAGIHSKKSILKSMFSPALLRARGAWTASGWKLRPRRMPGRLGDFPVGVRMPPAQTLAGQHHRNQQESNNPGKHHPTRGHCRHWSLGQSGLTCPHSQFKRFYAFRLQLAISEFVQSFFGITFRWC